MTAETLAHPVCAEVARLVAAEIAVIEQAFARRATRILLAMRPTVHDEVTNASAAAFDAAVRVTLREAGLPADAAGQSRMVPDGSGQSRTTPDDFGTGAGQ